MRKKLKIVANYEFPQAKVHCRVKMEHNANMRSRPRLIEAIGSKRLTVVAERIDNQFSDLGCNSYVKTIYVGYDLAGEMVAALYPHADSLEIALAIPEDFEHPLLVDASHLTWRTLPVAAIVRTQADLKSVADLITLACSSIGDGSHRVFRDNEYFMRSRRDRHGGVPEPESTK
jgi:hypothetical protein